MINNVIDDVNNIKKLWSINTYVIMSDLSFDVRDINSKLYMYIDYKL